MDTVEQILRNGVPYTQSENDEHRCEAGKTNVPEHCGGGVFKKTLSLDPGKYYFNVIASDPSGVYKAAYNKLYASTYIRTAKTIKLNIWGSEQEITYVTIDGLAIWQGDMIIGKVDASGDLIGEHAEYEREFYTTDGERIEQPRQAYDTQGNLYDIPEPSQPVEDSVSSGIGTLAVGVQTGSRKFGRRWYSKKIPYRINSSVPPEMKTNIKAALAEIEQKVGFDFWETDCSPGWSVRNNYILFKHDPNLSNPGQSFVGRALWGATEVTLRRDDKGAILHEIGHALGLFHEQARPDRDNYVTIQNDNIGSGEDDNFNLSHFDKIGGVEMFGSYDYHSIMHYSACAFAKEGELCESEIQRGITTHATIVPHNPAMLNIIGKATEFSAKDIAALKEMYDEVKNNCDPGEIQVGAKEVCREVSDVCRYGADICVPLAAPQCIASHEVCNHEKRVCSVWSAVLFGGSVCIAYKMVCASWETVCDRWMYELCSFQCAILDKICDSIPDIVKVCVPDPLSNCR